MNLEITKKIRFNKLMEKMPEGMQVVKNFQLLNLIKCCSLPAKSLEEVLKKEGLSEDEIEKFVQELKNLQKEIETLNEIKPEKEDFTLKKIEEGNKVYFKIAKIMFTKTAISNIESLANKKYLKIQISAGGCSGYKYEFDYVEKSGDEFVFELSKKISVLLDKFTFAKLQGSIIDFKLGLHDSGLKIINPNIKGSCSCGASVGL